MLDYQSKLPKHLVVLSPILSEGKESPIKVDIKYEWLPLRCKQCFSLGHTATACPDTKVKKQAAPVAIYVQKQQSTSVDSSKKRDDVADTHAQVEADVDPCLSRPTNGPVGVNVAIAPATHCRNIPSPPGLALSKDTGRNNKGKEIIVYNPFEVLGADRGESEEEREQLNISQNTGPCSTMITVAAWNVRGLNSVAHQYAVGQLVRDKGIKFLGLLETRSFKQTDVHQVLISVVYGHCDSTRRWLLWRGLQTLSESITNIPWCVLGDFNAVIDSSESCGRVTEATNAMAEFREFITGAALVHLPFTGCPYTWHNCSEGSRSFWRQRRPEWGVFRFDNFLAKQPEFLNAVHGVWRHQIYGTKMYGVVCKLKALKVTFRAQRKIKGNLSNNVCLAKEFLEKAQGLFDMFKEDILLQLVQWCRAIYCKAVEIETSMLRQRAKLNWFKHGDQCSKIFFRKINAKRAKQRSLLGGLSQRRSLNFDFLQPHLKHTLTIEEANGLLLPVTQTEIKEAFFDISEDSAPGPDGYTSAFFKAAWPEIGNDICAAVTECFVSGRLLKQLNATLLVLIPKVQLPVRVSDFRPIACCNVVYKAISKILVQCMQRVLHMLIDYSKNAFVPGRSIADSILLAQELLAGYNQVRLPQRCTIKVDIQKAYDSVNWDFILESLKIFNFPSRFISWIEQCMTTATFSLSLNGSIHGFFKGSRGIRQGDSSFGLQTCSHDTFA
ncbi:UNVERIFIED_CONTAM: hypothetical protein Slati_2464600 [Sesamum latifolium]|uniref:Reverse transcriptase domain-containing protein n=1 Tax=Sesamum latifolium TaxID=2727402 RepID=A0AAW2WG94_9LAMI